MTNIIAIKTRGCKTITQGRVYKSYNYRSSSYYCVIIDDYGHQRTFRGSRFRPAQNCDICVERKCNSCPITKEEKC